MSLGETCVLELDKDIEHIQITSGRIRRYDTRITGDDALKSLRNQTIKDIDDFENFWKPVLFPELVSKKKRPDGWLMEGDIFEKNEDIFWNTGYTWRVFLEDLHPVRNSGTLLRDWEETLSWLYLSYEWENTKDILSQKNCFTIGKKIGVFYGNRYVFCSGTF